jgi:hypothetical protein
VDGDPVALTASVRAVDPGSAAVAGAVHFVVDGVAWGDAVPVVGGVASVASPALGVGVHTFEARYLGDAFYAAATSGAVAYTVVPVPPVVHAAVPAVALTVTKEPAKSNGKVLVHVTATAMVEGYSPTGRKVEVRVNGRAYRTLRTDGKGSVSLSLAEKTLQIGKNPVQVRFHPGSSMYPMVVTRSTAITVKRVPAVGLAVTWAVERGGAELVVKVKAKTKVAGYKMAGRTVKLVVNGKAVAAARTDSKGRATLVLAARTLTADRVTAKHLVIKFDPGSSRYRPTLSKTYRANLRGGLIGEVVIDK